MLDQKQITQASTIAYNFEECSVSFNETNKNPKNFYVQTELSDIMCINFPSILNNLAYIHDAKKKSTTLLELNKTGKYSTWI